MNTETAALSATAPAADPVPDLRTTLTTLLKRELWEHPALWRVPLIVAAVLALCTIFSVSLGIQINDQRLSLIGEPERIIVLNMSQIVWAVIMCLVSGVVGTFYALDCLYAERKDRSILFWKSLPVSDELTVLSKFVVLVVLLPLLTFVLASASHLLALAIWRVRVATGGVPDVVAWGTVAWLRGEAVIFLCMLLAVLWYAPLAAAALLLSAWVKRSPVLWATLPLLLLPIFEHIVFRTHYVWRFIQYRSNGVWDLLTHRDGHDLVSGQGKLLHDLNWAAAFASPDLWLGLLAAAAMLYGAARLRRYRDDG
jgi:ABC-2 type transport system permease protein